MMQWNRIIGLVCIVVVAIHQLAYLFLGDMPSSFGERNEFILSTLRTRLKQQNVLMTGDERNNDDVQQQQQSIRMTKQELNNVHLLHSSSLDNGINGGLKVEELSPSQSRKNETTEQQQQSTMVIRNDDPSDVHDNNQQQIKGPLPLRVEELSPKPTKRQNYKLQEQPNKLVLSADDFIQESQTSRAVIFHFPRGDFGLLCNILHQVSNGLDVAMTFPDLTKRVVFALEYNQSIQMQAALDVEMLVKGVRQVSKLDLTHLGIKEPLRDIQMILDWKADTHHDRARRKGHLIFEFSLARLMRMRRNESSIALTYFLRPHVDLRQKAERVVKEFRDKHPDQYLMSVHRRVFTWCKDDFKLHAPFCKKQEEWYLVEYFEDDCNLTMTPSLVRLTAREFLGQNEFPRPFSLFLASDLHDLAGDATFYNWAKQNGRQVVNIPHKENPEHVVSLAWANKSEAKSRLNLTAEERLHLKNRYEFIKDFIKGEFGGFDMSWDVSMLTDMHAQTLSDYAIGQPFSSCDRILALWRSVWGKAALSSYLESNNEFNVFELKNHLVRWEERLGQTKYHQTYPKLCYEPFDHPKSGEYDLLNRMKLWWKTHEHWWLNGTSRLEVPSLDGAVSGIQTILPPKI